MGATFGGAGESALSPLVELAFALTSDGSLPTQADNDQPTVETLLKDQMKESEGWGGATKDALFSGLPDGVPFVLGLIAKLAEQITGIDISGWIDDWNNLPVVGQLPDIIGDALGTIFTQSVNVLSMLGDLNFLDPDFDPGQAIESFIQIMLLPANLLAGLVDGLLPDDLFGGFDASKIISGAFPMEMISGLLDFLADVPGLSQVLEWFGLDGDGDEGDLQGLISSFLTMDSPLDAFNLFNLIPSKLLSMIPYNIVGDATHENMLTAGGFNAAVNVQGNANIVYDPVHGRTSPGCVAITANGSEQRLLSNAMNVAEGDTLDHIIYCGWSGLTFTGVPFRTRMVRLLDHNQVGIDNLTAPSSPGSSQAGFAVALHGSYTVPAGCDQVCYELTVNASATAGTINFDDGWVYKDNQLQIPWTEGLPQGLQDLLDGAQETIDTIFSAISGIGGVGTLLSELFDALQNIPFLNILGVGGPANIGGSVQATWDQWVSGLVGSIGTGAGLPDLFNLGQIISGNAAKGGMSFDILGIRNNKPLKTGFLPTSISNINLDKVAIGSTTAVTVPITPTTALMSYHIIEESMPIGAIQWQGYGTANITSFILNIYTMNPLTGICDVLLHNSADIKGLLTGGSGPPFPVTYSLPTATDPLLPGTIVGVEMVVRGSGAQHNVAGGPTWLQDQAVYPRRWSSVRDSSSVLSPSSITPSYTTTNVPAVEIAVSASPVALPHAPSSNQFTTSGSVPIPSWCNYIDVITLGAGGGSGTSGFTDRGDGGHAGSWNSITLQRNVSIPLSTALLNYTIGVGGIGGDWIGDGGAGGASSVSAVGISTITAAGGAGGDSNGGGKWGLSPGNHVHNGVTYAGGGQQNSLDRPGIAPGGGASTPNSGSTDGYQGAPGRVWIVFRQ